MAEQQKRAKPVEAASAAPGERRSVSPPSRPLARAAEASHGDAQQALANLETARRNLEAAQREGVQDPDAEEAERTARKQLEELGYG